MESMTGFAELKHCALSAVLPPSFFSDGKRKKKIHADWSHCKKGAAEAAPF
jgi:hypothetical protein